MVKIGAAVALLFVFAGCGDESFRAQLFDFLEEDVRSMNAHESGVFQGVAHNMDLPDQSEPAIAYCTGDSGHCVDTKAYPGAIGEYRPLIDTISIDPKWKGVDGLLAHEAIHAILWKRTGDADPFHTSPYFRALAPAEYIGSNHR